MSLFRPNGRGPLLYAHRGASAHAPENTLRAFDLALEHGADGVELDVRLSKDGEVVVLHDATLDRTAGRPGRARELTYAELRSADVGRGEPVPRLDDVLDLVTSRGKLVNIEAKTDDVDRVALARALARLVARRDETARERLFFSTFHPDMLLLLKAHARAVPCAFLFEADLRGRALGLVAPYAWRPRLLHPHFALVTAERLARWHARGVTVNTWTVDDAYEVARLARLGVDGLITNDPRRTRALLDNSP